MGEGEKLSEHFRAAEFKCRDGSPLPEDFAETIRDTVEFLELLRLLVNVHLHAQLGEWLDIGLFVTSGYRSERYNRRVGGAPQSRHVTGQAADVRPTRAYDSDLSYADFCALAEAADEYFTDRPYRLGFYPSKGPIAWIHVDCAYGFGGRRWTD